MRIIHLVRAKTWGGGEQYARDLCEYSARQGNKLIVCTRGLDFIDRKFSFENVRLEKMSLGGVLDFISPLKLARIIRSCAEDSVILHVHNFKDAEIAIKARKIARIDKKVIIVCSRHLVKPGKKSLRWKMIYSGIDRLVFVSEFSKMKFLSSDPPVDVSKICVVHNSILPLPSHTKYTEGKHNTVKLLFVGRISEEKGLDVLIESLSKLKWKDVRLTIVGTGPTTLIDDLKNRAEKVGVSDRIDWKGFAENVYSEIVVSDICISPSRAQEAFGLTLLEYMSQGKPVIATNNGAQNEIITNGIDGLLVQPESVQNLSEAIGRLISDDTLRENMGKAAYQTFMDKFSYPVFFQKMKEVYENTIA